MNEKKQAEQHVHGLSSYSKKKNDATVQKVNRVIDQLHAQDAVINFAVVARLAGVSRGTLYNNVELCERIRRLRAGGTDQMCEILREKNHRQEEELRTMRRQIRCLKEEKKKLIVQLIDYEELRRENERLRHTLQP